MWSRRLTKSRPRAQRIPRSQVGLIPLLSGARTPTDDDIFPVRAGAVEDGASRWVCAARRQSAGAEIRHGRHEPIEKLIAWAKKTYPINPRRVYMFGKGEGGKISAEFTMTASEYRDRRDHVIAGAVGVCLRKLKEAIDLENSAPEFYMNLGLRDLATHLTTVRDTYPRVKAKGYHVIYREFEDMGVAQLLPAEQ